MMDFETQGKFERGSIRLYQADCMEAMRQIPDKWYELCICDPPYGIGESMKDNTTRGVNGSLNNSALGYAKNYKISEWDKYPPSEEYFNQLCRISKNQIIWGGNYFGRPGSSCWIVWDKDNGNNDFADCELAWTSFKTAVRKFKFKWHGMLQEDMKNKEYRIHRTQKPVKLYEWLLKNYAKPGDKILDTHGGSMSHAIACYNLDFALDLFELDGDYYKAGVERFQQHIKQQRLFDKEG